MAWVMFCENLKPGTGSGGPAGEAVSQGRGRMLVGCVGR